MSELEQANVRKIEADTDAVLIGSSVISTEEARERVAADPDSPYQSLELNEEVEGDPHKVDDDGNLVDETDVSDESTIAEISLNGAQVGSIVEIVARYTSGELPLEAAIAILTTSFPIDDAHARRFFKGIVPGSTKPESDDDPTDDTSPGKA